MPKTAEHTRLREDGAKWKHWGPYLSERQWGTVREDYSANGDAWNYFSHDQARSRAYRWGEDGLAGISDHHQVLCFALALWNGKDPILKERLFGLTNSEGNHGEDVKEYYFYLDSTPTHSYMMYLYKYPHAAYPYDNLVVTNRLRGKAEAEYELLDTGVFNNNRYCDVFVEYAKESPDDMCIQINVCNRGKEAASLHVLPTLWFRNTWSWQGGGSKPVLQSVKGAKHRVIHARLFGAANRSPYVKDGINNYIVHGQKDAVNPDGVGTKASPDYQLTVGPGARQVVRLRLTRTAPGELRDPFGTFDAVMKERLKEADEFYDAITPPSIKADRDRASVMRQALAGMLWSKQYFYFDADQWLKEHHAHPLHRGTTKRAAIASGST